MLNQQDFLLESIRKVPELAEEKEKISRQIITEDENISEKRKIFSSQEENINKAEANKGMY